MNALLKVLFFLTYSVFMFAIFIVWLRIFMRWFKVSRIHPVFRSIADITDIIVQPIRNVLRISDSPGQRYDVCVMITLGILEGLKFTLLPLLLLGQLLPLTWFLIYCFADLIVQPLNLIFYAVIIRVIVHIFNIQWHHPLAEIVNIITTPVLRLARKIVPEISGIDFSPALVIIVTKGIVLFITLSLPVDLL